MKCAAAGLIALALMVFANQAYAQSATPESGPNSGLDSGPESAESRPQAEDRSEILSLVEALPEAIRQVAVLPGPPDTGVRFILIRMDDKDRLFVHERDGLATKVFFEVVEVAGSSERIVDIRSELDSTGIVAFVDAVASSAAETTYELFLDKAAPGTYTFHAASN